MVTIGYSKPYVALYSGEGGKDTYTGGMALGGGVSYSDSIDVADDNNFYADNMIDESESGVFTGGSADISVNFLSQTAAKMILGLKSTTSVGDTQWNLYDDESTPPDIGYGHVKKVMDNGDIKWVPFVLPRVKFNLPAESAETQEDSINWQVQELSLTIMRSLNGTHPWRAITNEVYNTEAEAYEAVTAYLSQSAGE